MTLFLLSIFYVFTNITSPLVPVLSHFSKKCFVRSLDLVLSFPNHYCTPETDKISLRYAGYKKARNLWRNSWTACTVRSTIFGLIFVTKKFPINFCPFLTCVSVCDFVLQYGLFHYFRIYRTTDVGSSRKSCHVTFLHPTRHPRSSKQHDERRTKNHSPDHDLVSRIWQPSALFLANHPISFRSLTPFWRHFCLVGCPVKL